MNHPKLRKYGVAFGSAVLSTALYAAPATAATSDGPLIAYTHVQSKTGAYVVQTVNLDTGAHRLRVVNGSSPAWSPNGHRLAFITSLSRIAIRNADGSITRTGVPAYGLAGPVSYLGAEMDWSPDGRYLAYFYEDAVWVMSVTAPYAPHQLTSGDPGEGWSPSWSPDSRQIVYAHEDPSLPSSDLFVINADGTDNLNVTDTPNINEADPDWSPDGKSFAYYAENVSGSPRGLYVSASNGSGANLVADSPDLSCCGSPDWSPTGTRIVFDSGNKLVIINADGTNERAVAASNVHPAWQPLS